MTIVIAVAIAVVVGAALGYAFRGKINKGIKDAGNTAKSAVTSVDSAVNTGVSDITKKL